MVVVEGGEGHESVKSREGDRRARSRVETAGPPAERVSEGAGRDHPDRTYRGKELPRHTQVVFSSYFFFSLRWLSGTQAWQIARRSRDFADSVILL